MHRQKSEGAGEQLVVGGKVAPQSYVSTGNAKLAARLHQQGILVELVAATTYIGACYLTLA